MTELYVISYSDFPQSVRKPRESLQLLEDSLIERQKLLALQKHRWNCAQFIMNDKSGIKLEGQKENKEGYLLLVKRNTTQSKTNYKEQKIHISEQN